MNNYAILQTVKFKGQFAQFALNYDHHEVTKILRIVNGTVE